MQAELVLPAEAVGLELVEQVEHGQVVAELLAGRVARRSPRRSASPQWKVTPLVLDEREARRRSAASAIALAAIDEPGLIDLVLGEADADRAGAGRSSR